MEKRHTPKPSEIVNEIEETLFAEDRCQIEDMVSGFSPNYVYTSEDSSEWPEELQSVGLDTDHYMIGIVPNSSFPEASVKQDPKEPDIVAFYWDESSAALKDTNSNIYFLYHEKWEREIVLDSAYIETDYKSVSTSFDYCRNLWNQYREESLGKASFSFENVRS